jgi:uncharacterized membrane protein YhaH (DUF805 family)
VTRAVTTALAWVGAHALALALLAVKPAVTADVHYYWRGLNGVQPGAMDEYPEVGTWPARLVNALTGSEDAFVVGFIGLCLLCSAVFTVILYCADPSGRRHACHFWILFVAVSGPIVETRLDLFPGLAVAGCAVVLTARSRASRAVRTAATALLAAATMMKLWPGILAASLVGGLRSRGTWRRVAGFAVSLGLLCLLVAVIAGPDRLTSPLSYQGDRGLQVESLVASPLVVAASLAPEGTWRIHEAASKSIEIFGPGVAAALVVATVLTVATVLAALVWAVRRLRRADWSPELALSFMMTLVMLLILSNKVFSPQYVTWIAPLTAVALLVGGDRRVVRRTAVGVLVLAGLTTLVFPVFYDSIILRTPPATAGALLLLLRAGTAVAVTVGCVRWMRDLVPAAPTAPDQSR